VGAGGLAVGLGGLVYMLVFARDPKLDASPAPSAGPRVGFTPQGLGITF
jgi:hypothetical protein